jgi:hypothetical protein
MAAPSGGAGGGAMSFSGTNGGGTGPGGAGIACRGCRIECGRLASRTGAVGALRACDSTGAGVISCAAAAGGGHSVAGAIGNTGVTGGGVHATRGRDGSPAERATTSQPGAATGARIDDGRDCKIMTTTPTCSRAEIAIARRLRGCKTRGLGHLTAWRDAENQGVMRA